MYQMYQFRKATLKDIPLLLECRIALLHSAIGNGDEKQWTFVKKQIEQYYQTAIQNNTHIAFLAFHGNTCVGTGGVCFYQVLPTYFKPTGKKAYIINMYTVPEYRNQGIATQILDFLVKECLQRNISYISLEATDMGRSVYEKFGFAPLHSEMQYIINSHKKQQ